MLPAPIVQYVRRIRLEASRRYYGALNCREVFDDIYRNSGWGGTSGELCSGDGSRGPAAAAYVEAIAAFIREHDISNIVDIGCGDFYIGRAVLSRVGPSVRYIGIDVSSVVIDQLTKVECGANVEFLCIDAARDPIPEGDIVLIRQVLQHLSNEQIHGVLSRIKKFPYAIITEHCPDHVERFNSDIPHGPDTRLVDNSVVALDKPPFNIENLRYLFECPTIAGGKIVSWLIEHGEARRA
jgi:SAM-dependent methyltransferase